MTSPETPSAPRVDASSAPTPMIQDRRVKPRGALPRQTQMWLMVGLAFVILVIIFFTGRPEPASRPSGAGRPTEPALAATDRIRTYRQQLADDEARQRQVLAQQTAPTPTPERVRPSATEVAPPDPLKDERRRREYQSLFADSIALSRRPPDQQPNARATGSHVTTSPAPPNMTSGQQGTPSGSVVSAPSAAPAGKGAPSIVASDEPSASRDDGAKRDEDPAERPRLRLLEGTLIEAVLANRLDAALAGPVDALVTGPVYSHDRQAVLIPAGARVLGAATPVQSWGESRLAVSFHRLIMPDGHTYSLDRFKGLDAIGETGLRDSVNRHYLQVFGASVAIGAIAGLAQYNTRSGFDVGFGDAYRQAAGASLASSTARILDRYLNVLPTITIREGYRLKVYLTNDLDLPAYGPATGGEP
jgi:type IV secretory pathway VirB10-like protein